MGVDWRCYLVTAGINEHVIEVASRAAQAGCGVVQVRAKDTGTRELLAGTLALAKAVSAVNPGTRVLVDDRCDVAFAAMRRSAHVHGVHLGSEDLPVEVAREMLGPQAIIGLTTGTLELVRAANRLAGVIDYVGAGPFRLTPTKDSGRPPLGVEGYGPLCAQSRVPVIAIGDVTAGDVPALAAQGVAGVALVRAFANATDPGQLVREIHAGFAS